MKLKIEESAAVENVESGVQNENEVMLDDDVSSLHSFDSFPPSVEGDLNEESFELIKLDCGDNEDKPEQCWNGTSLAHSDVFSRCFLEEKLLDAYSDLFRKTLELSWNQSAFRKLWELFLFLAEGQFLRDTTKFCSFGRPKFPNQITPPAYPKFSAAK